MILVETYFLHLTDSVVHLGRIDVRAGLEAFQISTLGDSGLAGRLRILKDRGSLHERILGSASIEGLIAQDIAENNIFICRLLLISTTVKMIH